jgi:hypothetical protein
MVQNQHDRKLCTKCQRNVFPVRPKPNMAFLILLFILVVPGIIYLIFYGLKPKIYCPICYSKVSETIDYHYPPFRNGDPNSFDPKLIGGTVIRTEPTIMNPEGEFVDYVDPPEKLEKNISTPRTYCKFCGIELQDPNIEKCPNCGTSRTE